MPQGLTDYQLKFRGLTVGRNTPYGIRSVVGLFDVDVESSAVPIPRGDGDIPGGDNHIRSKDIEIEFGIEGPKQSAELAGYIKDIRSAFRRIEDEDPEPMYFKVPDDDEQFIRVRHSNIAIQEDVQSEHGLKPITVRLHASDPRLYSTDSDSDVIDIYEPDSGSVNFALNFPVNFASAGIEKVFHNAGTARAYPILRFFGPEDGGSLDGVTIINETTGQQIDINSTILTGQVLKADMLAYIRADGNQVIGLDGSSRYGDWQLPREPFYLAPGDNILRYEVTGTTLESQAQIIWFDTST